MVADLNFAYLFPFCGDKVSFIYLFQQKTISATIVNFFIAAVVVVGLSGGRFPDEKAHCLSSKTREKNVCRGRMIRLRTEMAREAEVYRGNFA